MTKNHFLTKKSASKFTDILYQTLFAALNRCRYHCGVVRNIGCSCDSSCLYYNDCCGDYLKYCHKDDKKDDDDDDDDNDGKSGI